MPCSPRSCAATKNDGDACSLSLTAYDCCGDRQDSAETGGELNTALCAVPKGISSLGQLVQSSFCRFVRPTRHRHRQSTGTYASHQTQREIRENAGGGIAECVWVVVRPGKAAAQMAGSVQIEHVCLQSGPGYRHSQGYPDWVREGARTNM